MALDPVSAALDIGGKLIDRLWPDPAQRDAAKVRLVELQQSGDAATQQLQTMQETQGVTDQATQAAKQMALENAQQANAAAEQAMQEQMHYADVQAEIRRMEKAEAMSNTD